ncbi:MAG: sulfite exporter TauE/SafE family protein [Gammaproteobacteria bacterium]|nr:sulfite exporter TauE/SafE family protein [Gammaproteobacteria bacterium]
MGWKPRIARSLPSSWRESAVLGAGAGLLNGLIALGGGIVITPVLVGRRRVPPQVAVGTSLAAVAMLSTIGFVFHFSVGGLIVGPGAIVLSVVSGCVGAVVGAKLLAKITPRWMLMLFGAFILVVAIRLVVQGLGLGFGRDEIEVAVPMSSFALFGFVSGMLSGVFGVGGGALVLLGLAAFYGLPVQEGLPLALALNVSNALIGLVGHARAGRVLCGEVKVLIPTAIIGVALGAWLAQQLPADAMRIIFGVFFLYTGVRIGRQGLHRVEH